MGGPSMQAGCNDSDNMCNSWLLNVVPMVAVHLRDMMRGKTRITPTVLGSFAMGSVPTLITTSPSTQTINGCPKTGLSANAGDAVSPVERGLDLHLQDHSFALSFWRVVPVGTISWATDESNSRARGRVRLASILVLL